MNRLRLKKGEDKRIRGGHPWIYSNEVDTAATPLKSFTPGEEVIIETQDGKSLAIAYINPQSLIAARIISTDLKERLSPGFFAQRLQTALSLRERLFDQPYYRLVYSEADGLPGLIIDRFNEDFVIQVNTAGIEPHHTDIADALTDVIPATQSIYLRNDSPIRQMEGLELYCKTLVGNPPRIGHVIENGVNFKFPFTEGQKTGWFYDHRMTRARLNSYVTDQTVLDVFSYLGGFGIQAAVFGARDVVCLDASETACDFIQKNAELNQVADKVSILCNDAFDGLKELKARGQHYDVIILDPPAFVKKAKDKKAGLAAYQRLNELAMHLLKPGGFLFSCSCSMQVTEEEFYDMIKRAAYKTHTTLQLLERGHQGPDHPIHIAIPESNYLKSLILRKN